MSKALVIKGANFSANKVETVTLSSPVPCTGLALSQDSMTPTSLGVAGTLTATLTPVGTTDILVWSSSDTDVATVENGVVTVVGLGSATITASCGEQTATCAVTVDSITINLDTAFHAEAGARYSNSIDLNANPVKDHVGYASDAKSRLFYSTEQFGTYRAFVYTEHDGKYAMPLPKGATHVSVNFPGAVEKRYTFFVLLNAFEKQTYITGSNGDAALGIYGFFINNTAASANVDFSEYADQANGFILSWQVMAASSTDISQVGETTVTFS